VWFEPADVGLTWALSIMSPVRVPRTLVRAV
jgi:hypothetical protein